MLSTHSVLKLVELKSWLEAQAGINADLLTFQNKIPMIEVNLVSEHRCLLRYLSCCC